MVRLALFCFCLLAVLGACNSEKGPVLIELNRDSCSSCKMTIVDGRFGGEIVSDKGKVYKFDAVDCLIRFLRDNPSVLGKVFIVDFAHPGTLLESSQVVFGALESKATPMGSRYVGFASVAEAEANLGKIRQPLMNWAQLSENLVK